MTDWRHKKDRDSEQPEDFILFRDDIPENSDVTESGAEINSKITSDNPDDTGVLEPVFSSTDRKSDSDINDTDTVTYVQKNAMTAFENDDTIQFDIGDDGFSPAESNTPKTFYEKYKSTIWAGGITITAGIVIAVLIIVLSVFTDPLRNYSQVAVAKGNVINSMNTSGTLSANSRYSITSLVSGTITASTPEVGDKVTAGTVLYRLDDTEAQLAVKRAENQLARSKALGSDSSSTSSSIYATESGTIQTLNIKSGYKISVGQVIGTIKKADNSISAITTPVSGTVSSVSSGVGKTVSAGTLLATVTTSQTQTSSSTTYDQKSNEYDVEYAKKQLEYYTIKAPVTGIVTEKNAKVGDNVGITDMENPMMVIVDMNSLKFTFQVDEYTVWDIETGQSAIINTDSLPDETFAGEVTRISNEGYPNDEGKTVFDVEITINEPGNLKAGMNITAKVIIASATNVMYLPKEALMEADGKHALVLVKEDAVMDSTSQQTLAPSEVPKEATDEELAFPSIDVPKGCKLITVSYGIADDTNVQIISGLSVGDIVVYDPKREPTDLSAPSSTSSPVNTDATVPKSSSDSTKSKSDSTNDENDDESRDNTRQQSDSISETELSI